MQTPVQVTFHQLPATPTIEELVRQSVADLERHFERIVSCRVSIEAPPHNHDHGHRFKVQIDLGVPGQHLIVARSAEVPSAPDASAAVRDAFRAAKRQLDEYVRKQRGDVKVHGAGPETIRAKH